MLVLFLHDMENSVVQVRRRYKTLPRILGAQQVFIRQAEEVGPLSRSASEVDLVVQVAEACHAH